MTAEGVGASLVHPREDQDGTKNIAVVGGGAKAAALAARAHALRKEGVADIGVTIFEQDEIGANWTGRGGYTDGAQRLCTQRSVT